MVRRNSCIFEQLARPAAAPTHLHAVEEVLTVWRQANLDRGRAQRSIGWPVGDRTAGGTTGFRNTGTVNAACPINHRCTMFEASYKIKMKFRGVGCRSISFADHIIIIC